MDGVIVAAGAGVLTTVIATIGGLVTTRKHKTDVAKAQADAVKATAEAAKAQAEAAKLKVEADQVNRDTVTRAHQAIQDAYQDLITDLRSQVAASAQEASSARAAARESASKAAESEANAWRAEQQVLAMARFLVELRPVIAQYVPGADAILERIDKFSIIH